MATSPGQRFVRRHNAARTTTSNTTAADVTYDTAVLSEGGYSWASPEVTVDEAGLYLCIWDIGEVQLASTRAVGTLVPSINTTNQTLYKARHRYTRNSGGNHNVSFGAAILDLSVNDDVKIRNPGTVSGTDAFGNYATNVNQGGGFQMVRLNAGNFTEVQRTTSQSPVTITYANTTRPWLDSTLSTAQITWTSEVRDDDGLYSGSGGDLTLAANTKYLIVYGATLDGSSSQRHTHHLQLEIGGNNVQHSTGYERNNSSDGPPMQGMYLHETGGATETLRVNVGVEQEDNLVSNTVGVDNAYLQVLELPADAEWIHVDNGATNSLTTALAGTSTYYDTPLSSTFRADGDSNLSLDGANDAVQNDSGASMPILAIGWHMWDRDSGASGTRKHCWSYWDNGGTRLAYGISGGYNRGQQGNDDTHRLGYVGAATMDLANGADLSFVVRDPQSGANSDMGIYASTSRYFLGVQVLNLDTLVAGSTNTDIPAAAGSFSLTGNAADISVDTSVDAAAGSFALTGQGADISMSRPLDFAAGAYNVTGSGIDIPLSRQIGPDAGSFNLTGHDATVNTAANTNITPDAGAFALSGHDFALDFGLVLDSGSYSLLGYDLTATIARQIAPGVGSYALTGHDISVNTSASTNIAPQAGSYSFTGQNLAISLSRPVDADSGSFALFGYGLDIPIDISVDLAIGSYALSGSDLSLAIARNISLDAGSFALTGFDANFGQGTTVDMDAGAYALSGNALTALIDRSLDLAAGSFVISGQNATVLPKYGLEAGSFALTGYGPEISAPIGIDLDVGSFSLSGYTFRIPELDPFPRSGLRRLRRLRRE